MIATHNRIKGCFKTCMIVALVALLASSVSMIPVQAAFSWIPLSGETLSSPAIAGVYGERRDIVVRGKNNGVYHKYWTSTGGWSGWIDLHGKTPDQPAVAYTIYNMIHKDFFHVVIRGMNNKIYHKKFDLTSATWDTSWDTVEPAVIPWTTSSTPALASAAVGTGRYLIALIRGQDNYLYYAWWDGWNEYWIGYAGKTWLQGKTKDVPAVAVYQDQIHVVVRGMDDWIYYRKGTLTNLPYYIEWNMLPGPGGTDWYKMPGTTISAPTLWGSDYYGLQLFVRGSDNALYWWALLGDATWFTPLYGGTLDRPAFWIEPPSIWHGSWCLYVRGTNNGVYRKCRNWNYVYNNYEWEDGPTKGWTFLDGHTLSAPAIDNYCLCVRGTNHVVYRLGGAGW